MSTVSDLPIDEAVALLMSQAHCVRIPSAHDRVFNDECCVSFDSPFSDNGLFINLKTWLAYGRDHVFLDSERTQFHIYLHSKWDQVPVESTENEASDAAPTKLAIGVEGGFKSDANKYEIVKNYKIAVVSQGLISFLDMDSTFIDPIVITCATAIIEHPGMKSRIQMNTWDSDNEKLPSKYAMTLEQLPADRVIPMDPSKWACEMSGQTSNLWLNLSTGYIGGGRKNWDGTGGSGAALQHFIDTGKKYPLCVKLGTITAHTADVWSYADDEDCLVIDPKLNEHLLHWGIDMTKLEKTDKSLGEMEVDLNMKYDWSRITESGESLEVVHAPGYVGLKNIGSSCYMNSIIQVLGNIPDIRRRYYTDREMLLSTMQSDPSSDLLVQMSKVMHALFSTDYIYKEFANDENKDKKDLLYKHIIAPYMFKALVGKNHAEFSSSRQQDASEYLTHLLTVLERTETTQKARLFDGGLLTHELFQFQTASRFECMETKQVKYISDRGQNMIDLRIPVELARSTDVSYAENNGNKKVKLSPPEEQNTPVTDQQQQQQQQSETVVESRRTVDFEDCLQTYFGNEIVSIFNPSVNRQVNANKTMKMKNFPKYLVVKLNRYTVDFDPVSQSVKVMKIDVNVPVPEHMDLTRFLGGNVVEGEVLMPEEQSINTSTIVNNSNNNNNNAGFTPNEEFLAQLLSLGFTEIQCKNALFMTKNSSLDDAVNTIFSNELIGDALMYDNESSNNNSGNNASSSSSIGVSEDVLSLFSSMGFNERQVKAALISTDNNPDRAMDWLFSHTDELDHLVSQILDGPSATTSSTSSSSSSSGIVVQDPGNQRGQYDLIAIVSHIGKNTDHGHYVCHLKKTDGWILCNDEKIAKSKNPPFEQGFMYIFQRNDK